MYVRDPPNLRAEAVSRPTKSSTDSEALGARRRVTIAVLIQRLSSFNALKKKKKT